MNNYPLVFRISLWLIAVIGVAVLIALAGAVHFYRMSGLGIESIGLGGLALLFGAGILEALVSRIVLGDDALEFVSNFRRTRVKRSDIERVVAEKGCPIALRLRSGVWIKLPVGTNLHPNTIRAWLRRES